MRQLGEETINSRSEAALEAERVARAPTRYLLHTRYRACRAFMPCVHAVSAPKRNTKRTKRHFLSTTSDAFFWNDALSSGRRGAAGGSGHQQARLKSQKTKQKQQ